MVLRERLYTVAEFEVFIAREENAERFYELIDGEIVEKVPTEEHSLIVGNFYLALRTFVDPRDLGRVAFEVRRRAKDDDQNSRLPDCEFTSKARLLPVVKKGAVPQMPDLAIEVKSPDDTFIKLRQKAIYYLNNGTRLVWLVFPDQRQIEIHTSDSAVKTLDIDDTLDGGNVLPGFSVLMKDMFRGL
jgi:Uma2 family endonuclease